MGDLVSIYLAILQKIDPAPVKVISELKSELKKRINIIEKLKEQLRQMTEKVLWTILYCVVITIHKNWKLTSQGTSNNS